MSLRIGDITLAFLSDGVCRLDGGSLFGVVPRTMWSRWERPDRRNRVTIGLNCLLIQAGGKNILLDTGAGAKHPPNRRALLGIRAGRLPRALRDAGLGPNDIHIVALTHLHFDHAGGATMRDRRGRIVPTFPNAKYLVQRADWEEATDRNERTRSAYYPDDFLPLHDAGLVDLLDGDCEVVPRVWLRRTGGHTKGHQMLHVEAEGRAVVSLGDVLPTPHHLPPAYTTAWDLYPLETLRAKREWLDRAASEGHVLAFGHGTTPRAGTVLRSGDRFTLSPLDSL